MKFLKLFLIFSIVFLISSCAASKKAKKDYDKAMSQEIEVVVPLVPENTKDTETHFRAFGMGSGGDFYLAYQIALTNARAELATKIDAKVRSAIESYKKQHSNNAGGTNHDYGQVFETYGLVVANTTLNGSTVVEEKHTVNVGTNIHTAWVSMEIPKTRVVEEVVSKSSNLPADVKKQIESDRDAFKKYVETFFNE